MNDDELRAFLESATVESDPAPRTDTAETSPNSQAQPESGDEAQQADSTQTAGLSFEEVLSGGRSTDAPVKPHQPAAATPLEAQPLVLPNPSQSSHADPHLTPLHLPEPRRPYDTPPVAQPVVPAVANAAPIDEFPPTEPLQRADMPAARGSGEAANSLEATTSPNTAPPASSASTAPLAAGVAAAATSATPAPHNYEPVEVTGEARSVKRWVPWAIVGGGAAVALVASLLIVNTVTGGSDPAPNDSQTATSDSTSPGASESVTPRPSTPVSPTTPTETEKPDNEDTPPVVEVGPTMTLPVSQWGITADLSSRFGQTFYNINTPENLVLNSTLIDSLPESCAAMRQQWGILRVDGSQYEVLKPAERCADAPELWDELWGLTAAMVETVTPQ